MDKAVKAHFLRGSGRHFFHKGNTTMNMTEGRPLALLSVFALPLLIGNLFQQAYNLADSMIVGRLLGADALAAVGATGSISFLFLFSDAESVFLFAFIVCFQIPGPDNHVCNLIRFEMGVVNLQMVIKPDLSIV